MVASFAPAITALLKQVEATSFSTYLRTSTFGYPLLEIIHLIGIATLFGTVLLVDLSVIGKRARFPVEQWGNSVLRLTVCGFAIAFVSGLLLLTARASEIAPNPAFWLKMTLLLLAGLNAMLLHYRRGLSRTDGRTRLQAAASILLWIGIISCGRMIAYV
jgi:hypothetical protein